MEDILILIFQVLFELLAYLPWDFLSYRKSVSRGDSEREFWDRMLIAVASFGLGGAVGWLSLLFLPDLLAKWAWLRMASLVILPLISGTMAYVRAKWRKVDGWRVSPMEHFWWSFLFTFGLVAMRFAFGMRL